MYIIAGLGNPGKEYENTRHNMGFKVIDRISEKYGISVTKNKFNALIGEGRIGTDKVILVKPQTYMNLSGNAVREIMNFYKPDIEDLIVIYDDFDIPTGSLRIRKKGSAGSHNGMKSIVQQLGDNGFPRIRVGIGAPEHLDESENREGKVINHVIGRISKSQMKDFEEAIDKASDSAVCIVENDVDTAMNRYNTAKKKKKKEKTELGVDNAE